MATKIFGWGLLIIGIIIIGWTLYSSYNIFTGKTAAPEVFKTEEKTEIIPQKTTEIEILDIQAQMKEMVAQQLKGIISPDFISQLLNLIAWSIFAGLLIFSGAQISILGIKLIKK